MAAGLGGEPGRDSCLARGNTGCGCTALGDLCRPLTCLQHQALWLCDAGWGPPAVWSSLLLLYASCQAQQEGEAAILWDAHVSGLAEADSS